METMQNDDSLNLTREEDLRFVRALLAQTRRDFDPGIVIFITWGLICLLGYNGTFLFVSSQHDHWISPMWFGLLTVGGVFSMVFGYRLLKNQRKKGFVSHIDIQMNWLWAIAVGNGLLWSLLGYFRDFYGGPGFFWAFIYAVALSMTGVVYTREWLAGGMLIVAGMLLAHFFSPYAYVILGFSIAAGCILPAVVSRNRLKKMRKNIASK
ncbi:MAG: hypothetical protein WHS88_11140 [Anaerohalosphaeraceae bacterium]